MGKEIQILKETFASPEDRQKCCSRVETKEHNKYVFDVCSNIANVRDNASIKLQLSVDKKNVGRMLVTRTMVVSYRFMNLKMILQQH